MLKPSYPIHTARLTLRPLEDRDLNDLFEYYARPDVVRFLYWETRDLAQTKQALDQKKQQTELREEGAGLVLAVSLTETGKVIGEVTLIWRSQEHRQGEMGFVFNPAFQGHGYATEAARVVLVLGFAGLKLHRIYGRCDAQNRASYRLMERLGMRREAHFIQNEIFKGAWGDEMIYAILHDEWQAQQEATP
ncbi:MAG: GNAT family N-acetyltransferase [Anaerolineae bacterium]|nr:GNAT family N-acetyltransferase [Anaerolineae bacterium]